MTSDKCPHCQAPLTTFGHGVCVQVALAQLSEARATIALWRPVVAAAETWADWRNGGRMDMPAGQAADDLERAVEAMRRAKG